MVLVVLIALYNHLDKVGFTAMLRLTPNVCNRNIEILTIIYPRGSGYRLSDKEFTSPTNLEPCSI
jgi:hypothetical protein